MQNWKIEYRKKMKLEIPNTKITKPMETEKIKKPRNYDGAISYQIDKEELQALKFHALIQNTRVTTIARDLLKEYIKNNNLIERYKNGTLGIPIQKDNE